MLKQSNFIKHTINFIVVILLVSISLKAQNQKFAVYFIDKHGVEFNPYTYFHPAAIERRINNDVPLIDETDFPLNQYYTNTIKNLCDSVKGESRWLNALFIYANPNQILQIQSLPFVKNIQALQSQAKAAQQNYVPLLEGAERLLKTQTQFMQADVFAQKSLTGKGIRIAVFDAGFPNVDKGFAFEHIRKRNGIIACYDFVRNKENVYLSSDHGTMTLSCIAGKNGADNIGLGIDADFLLARTERSLFEPIGEEENWLMAAEWADKNGAHIINSSLGYTANRYFQKNMDGKFTLVSRAANMAAKKGILVVNAAGNEGDEHWTIISAPADADSVLTVGGINPWTGMHTKFSSYGPTSDGRLKPNVSALAWVIAANKKNTLQEVQGTSFASPLTAGFAACVLQEFPKIKVMDLFKKIEQSGHLYPYYDYAHGYGIPQASKAVIEQNTIPATFITEVDNGKQKIKILPEFFTEQNFIYSVNFSNNWDDDHVKDENYSSAVSTMVLKKIPNYFYWHVSSPDGKIDTYEVLMVENPDILQIPLQNYIGKTLRFHYKGYTLIQKID